MYEPTSCLNLYIHSSLEPKISWLNSSCERRLVAVRLRLHQCERSGHLCKQSVKGKRLADCKRIIRHSLQSRASQWLAGGAFPRPRSADSLNALVEEKPWKQRPEIWADQVEARLWLVLTLMLRGVLAVIGWRCVLSFVVHACCWIHSWLATRV